MIRSLLSIALALALLPQLGAAQGIDGLICEREGEGFLGAPFEVAYRVAVAAPPSDEAAEGEDALASEPPPDIEDLFPNDPGAGEARRACNRGGMTGRLECVGETIRSSDPDGLPLPELTERQRELLRRAYNAAASEELLPGAGAVLTDAATAAAGGEAAVEAAPAPPGPVTLTLTFRPHFTPGDPSMVRLLPSGPANLSQPDEVSEEEAAAISAKLAAQMAVLRDFEATLDAAATERLLDGAALDTAKPGLAEGVETAGPFPDWALPAECTSLFRASQERAELLTAREQVAARIADLRARIAAEREEAGVLGYVWDSSYVDRMERTLEHAEGQLAGIDRAIAEKDEIIRRRSRTLDREDRVREIAEIKADPLRLMEETQRRRAALVELERERAVAKWTLIEGERGYQQRLAAYDRLIERAEADGNSAFAAQLREDRGRLEEARDSWWESQTRILDGKSREVERLIGQNRAEGIGPTEDAGAFLAAGGGNAAELLETGARLEARERAARRVSADARTLGGSATETYDLTDFARDLGESNAELLDDPTLFVRRYGAYLGGSGQAIVDAAKDLVVLAGEAADTAGETFESYLPEIEGYEFNTWGRENLETINTAADAVATLDRQRLADGVTRIGAALDRRLETMAASGEAGIEEALRGTGYATTAILGAEEAVFAGLLKVGRGARAGGELADAAGDAARTNNAADTATDVARVNSVLDTGTDTARATNAGEAAGAAAAAGRTEEAASAGTRRRDPAESGANLPEETAAAGRVEEAETALPERPLREGEAASDSELASAETRPERQPERRNEAAVDPPEESGGVAEAVNEAGGGNRPPRDNNAVGLGDSSSSRRLPETESASVPDVPDNSTGRRLPETESASVPDVPDNSTGRRLPETESASLPVVPDNSTGTRSPETGSAEVPEVANKTTGGRADSSSSSNLPDISDSTPSGRPEGGANPPRGPPEPSSYDPIFGSSEDSDLAGLFDIDSDAVPPSSSSDPIFGSGGRSAGGATPPDYPFGRSVTDDLGIVDEGLVFDGPPIKMPERWNRKYGDIPGRRFKAPDGTTVHLGKRLGTGGNAAVFADPFDPTIVHRLVPLDDIRRLEDFDLSGLPPREAAEVAGKLGDLVGRRAAQSVQQPDGLFRVTDNYGMTIVPDPKNPRRGWLISREENLAPDPALVADALQRYPDPADPRHQALLRAQDNIAPDGSAITDAQKRFSYRDPNMAEMATMALGIREMNRRGLVWTDHKPPNFDIVRDPSSPTGYKMLIFDTDGIRPAVGADTAERFQNARAMQRFFDNTPTRGPDLEAYLDAGLNRHWDDFDNTLLGGINPGVIYTPGLTTRGHRYRDLFEMPAKSLESLATIAAKRPVALPAVPGLR